MASRAPSPAWYIPASAGRRSNCRSRERPTPDHQVDALGLAGIVVVQQKLRLLGQDRLAVLVVAVFVPPAVPTTCSGGMP